MLIMTILLLAVLFVAGLIHTLFNFPTKKFMACLQSLVIKTTPHVSTNPTIAQKKVKSGNANKAQLKSLFATFDKNNDGFITKQELRESLKNIGILMTEKEVVDIVENVDSNGDGLIDLDEFWELLKSMMNREEMTGELCGKEEEEEDKEEADLKEVFDVFDGNGDGLITVEELGLVLSSMGLKEGKRLEICQEMIRKVDMDGDGMVNFDEFKSMMKAGSRRLIPLS